MPAPTQLLRSCLLLPVFVLVLVGTSTGQQSVARQWNEVLLEGIRHDFARPTVHARNLFHCGIVTYDAWAAYEPHAKTYFLGDTLGSYACPFTGVPVPANPQAMQEEAINYAMYRLINHRFGSSPGAAYTLALADSLFLALGGNQNLTSINYASGSAAELGNYLASCMIAFGLQDGSREQFGYSNDYYSATNGTLLPVVAGNPNISDPNKWQPLTLQTYIDQSGNVLPLSTPEFLSPEWGNVVPFSMTDADMTTQYNGMGAFQIFHDPGSPPLLSAGDALGTNEFYQWGFSMVSIWSSHLDPADTTVIDISPASQGNNASYPTTLADYPNFYNLYDGGDYSPGHAVNPSTGSPYAPNLVKRGDYARVLAEFWADGPASETPPGHWFTLLNYVSDHPDFEKRWRGIGPVLDDLAWDVQAYFAMGGTMHDAAISAWSIKGWYDYLRPISAIRFMADQGQSTDTSLANYHEFGIPLHPGYIEVVDSTDALVGGSYQHLGKIKLKAWKGPDYISDPQTDLAGVDWILAERWWPYQRPSFVTPPFAGFISGHSTFSRAAAELMTAMTGDAYFPGGMAVFDALQDTFLVFEEGPSANIELQWATYRDASDQCSLSRIWGGIHPPADDIPGRLIGIDLGAEAFDFAEQCFDANGKPDVLSVTANIDTIADVNAGPGTFTITIVYNEGMNMGSAPVLTFPQQDPSANTITATAGSWTNDFTYVATFDVQNSAEVLDSIDVEVTNATNVENVMQEIFLANEVFHVETENPTVVAFNSSMLLLNDAAAGNQLVLTAQFSEPMDEATLPSVLFTADDPEANTLTAVGGTWLDAVTFEATYSISDGNEELNNISVVVSDAVDRVGNTLMVNVEPNAFVIDSRNPTVTGTVSSAGMIADANVGVSGLDVVFDFDEAMDQQSIPLISFPQEDPTAASLVQNGSQSGWQSATSYLAKFALLDANTTLTDIDIAVANARDLAGNVQVLNTTADLFSIDTENPVVTAHTVAIDTIMAADAGVATFAITVNFSEAMSQQEVPFVGFPFENPSATLSLNTGSSSWLTANSFEAVFDVSGSPNTLFNIDVSSTGFTDLAGNVQVTATQADLFHINIPDTVPPTGMQSVAGDGINALEIFPNPAREAFAVRAHFSDNRTQLTVLDYAGRVVSSRVLNQSENGQPMHYPTANLSAGVYFVQLTGDNVRLTKKVVVLHD